MKKSVLNLMAVIAIAAFFAISCSKEELQQQKEYPSALTLENWKAFVDAPVDIRQKVLASYQQEHSTKYTSSIPTDIDLTKNSCSSGYIGRVRAWNGNGWAGIANVIISSPGYFALSSNINSPGRYIGCSDEPETCMSYYTSSTNGVDVGDLITTQRHILGIESFNDVSHPNFTTADNAARKYVAADVNYDGAIDSDDIDLITDVILGITNFPENMVFVPESELELFSLSTNPTALAVIGFSQCQPNNNFTNWFRFAIKRGDVNGDFSF